MSTQLQVVKLASAVLCCWTPPPSIGHGVLMRFTSRPSALCASTLAAAHLAASEVGATGCVRQRGTWRARQCPGYSAGNQRARHETQDHRMTVDHLHDNDERGPGRWQLALIFNWMQQPQRIKHILGKRENAVMTQVCCTVAPYLPMAIVRRELQIDARCTHDCRSCRCPPSRGPGFQARSQAMSPQPDGQVTPSR